MSIAIRWIDEDRTVIGVTLLSDWTWRELVSAKRLALSFQRWETRDRVDETIGMIVICESSRLPRDEPDPNDPVWGEVDEVEIAPKSRRRKAAQKEETRARISSGKIPDYVLETDDTPASLSLLALVCPKSMQPVLERVLKTCYVWDDSRLYESLSEAIKAQHDYTAEINGLCDYLLMPTPITSEIPITSMAY